MRSLPVDSCDSYSVNARCFSYKRTECSHDSSTKNIKQNRIEQHSTIT